MIIRIWYYKNEIDKKYFNRIILIQKKKKKKEIRLKIEKYVSTYSLFVSII